MSASNAATTLASATQPAELREWAIDAAHTRVGFSVPHMVVSEVDGQFKTFSGKVVLDDADLARSQLRFEIDVKSIDTGNTDRDQHLRSGDFFDADNQPKITFASTAIEKNGNGYVIHGDLGIRGVTQRVALDATLSESVANPWGQQVRAARIRGSVKRQDFGLSWNKSLDKGGVLVGNTVTIDIKVELTQ